MLKNTGAKIVPTLITNFFKWCCKLRLVSYWRVHFYLEPVMQNSSKLWNYPNRRVSTWLQRRRPQVHRQERVLGQQRPRPLPGHLHQQRGQLHLLLWGRVYFRHLFLVASSYLMGSIDITKSLSTFLQPMPLINLGNSEVDFSGTPRIEPGASGWEARMLPLCSHSNATLVFP